ncbi:Heterogeneous nuclear ribonucleoprotein C [Merluccius polli]|uniref:Heterogeneous nuclear ribonucleoprotein C n=1 Tax=Merluccius polli TaxID=89951 RepID=A0AA47P6K1_MERPO|nr:Heterogeneous nuclear ribonucleoprotein C [Merluccius polli]
MKIHSYRHGTGFLHLLRQLFKYTADPKRFHKAKFFDGTEFDLEYDSYQEDYYDRVYDYQRVPASLHPLPHGPSQAKRPRSSSHSAGHRRSRDRSHSKLSRAKSTSSTPAKLRMEELQVIKRELTLIKTQIDGLLDSLDKMDTQKSNHKGSPLREDSPAGSPYPPSASSPEQSLPPLSPPSSRHRVQRESPELGEATDDDHHSVNSLQHCVCSDLGTDEKH